MRTQPGTPVSKIDRATQAVATPGGNSRSKEEKIVVTVRLRPLNKKETLSKDQVAWECLDDHTIVSKPQSQERLHQQSSFTFDKVFGPESITDNVYEDGVKNNEENTIEEDEEQSKVMWHITFIEERHQIIELWHVCQVSIIHRTQFYRLFKGEQADQIYMEIELRRLTWLEQLLSEVGNATPACNGDASTVSLSSRETEETTACEQAMDRSLRLEARARERRDSCEACWVL
ncbi:unnamed protein product [Cochlearia groenlandica]